MKTTLITLAALLCGFNCVASPETDADQETMTGQPEQLQEVHVTLELATNWTGVINQKQELGYVVTNHIANITYQNEVSHFTLKTVASDIAVWRPLVLVTNGVPSWWRGVVPYIQIPYGTNSSTLL